MNRYMVKYNALMATYREMSARADRYRAMVQVRIRQTAKDAGIDPSMYTLHASNAMASFNSGHPWPGVNYSLVRKVRWLERTKLYAAHEIVHRYYLRKQKQIMKEEAGR